MAAPWPMPSPGGMAFSVKVTGMSFMIRGVACRLMTVSVKITGKPNIIRGGSLPHASQRERARSLRHRLGAVGPSPIASQ